MVKEALAGMVAAVFAVGMTTAAYAQTPAPKAEPKADEKKAAETTEKKADKKPAEKADKKAAPAKKEAKADKKPAHAKAPATPEKKEEKPAEAKK